MGGYRIRLYILVWLVDDVGNGLDRSDVGAGTGGMVKTIPYMA